MNMVLGNFEQKIDGTTIIAQGAVVVGSVTIEESCSIWYNAVIRGDVAPIRIGKNTNIQECCVIHTSWGVDADIGSGVTVGHGATLHGCKIGNDTLVGMRAVVMDGAEVGSNCLLGAGTIVTQGKKIPDGSLVIGNPGMIKRQLTPQEIEGIKKSAAEYYELAKLIIAKRPDKQ